MTTTVARCLSAATLLGALGACQARALVPNESDPLRDQIRTLQEEVDSLKRTNEELRTQLASVTPSAGTPDDDVIRNTPTVAELVVGWGTSVEVDPERPTSGVARVYVVPEDARGRFVQTVGYIDVTVNALPRRGGTPIPIGSTTLGPAQVRDAWRSGMFGTHYVVELPVDLSAAGDAPSAVVQATLREGLSGRSFSAAVPVPIGGGSGSAP